MAHLCFRQVHPLLHVPQSDHVFMRMYSEVFAVCSLGLFLPILLEQFARDNGVLMPDKTVPCEPPPASALAGGEEARCVVRIGWMWVDTASFRCAFWLWLTVHHLLNARSLYVFSTSVAIQALTVISMGSLADHPRQRKPILITFAFPGSLCATLFLLLPSTHVLWPLSALLAIGANVAFGASVVALNAYLPGLAKDAEEVREKRVSVLLRAGGTEDGEVHEGVAYKEAVKEYNTVLARTTSRISARGIALGYGSGILLLLLLLIPVTLLKGTTFSLRLCVGITGVRTFPLALSDTVSLASDLVGHLHPPLRTLAPRRRGSLTWNRAQSPSPR